MTATIKAGFVLAPTCRPGLFAFWKAIHFRFGAVGAKRLDLPVRPTLARIIGAQDLLAATLDGWDGTVSFVGPDGMGFTGHYWFLSHATERPKPWKRWCIKEAMGGHPPRRTVQFFLMNTMGAVALQSVLWRVIKVWDYRMARLIGSCFCRPK